MSLYLLVEGRQTERRVYENWIRHAFPRLRLVRDLSEFSSGCYFILCGHGYPSYMRRIPNALADIRDLASIEHFFICIDSEEMTYEEKLAEIQQAIEKAARVTAIHATHPRLGIHVIVQHCCMETWLLGHVKMLRRNPTSSRLVEMKQFYDVSISDPEAMGKPGSYLTRQGYHLAYLQEMLRERGITYTKGHPGVVVEQSYFDALRRRCGATDHLPSLGKLLAIWDGLECDVPIIGGG